MTGVVIRSAALADVDSVVRVLRDQTLDDRVGVGDELPRRVGRLIGDPNGRLLVATSGSEVVGAVALAARSTLLGAATEAWVEALATARHQPECVGRLLLEAAERAAVELGCTRLVAECSVARTAAHRLFEAHGWVDVHPVSRRVGRPAQPGAGLVNRFVAACAVAARDVSATISSQARRASPEDLHRAAARLATTALKPLNVPIHRDVAPFEGRRTDGDWWIVLGPVDGLCNAARGRGPYAFTAALARRGEPVAGVVVELTTGRRWIGVAGAGATLDGRPYGSGPSSPVVVGSVVATAPCRRLGTTGAVTVELCELAGYPTGSVIEVALPALRTHELAAPLVVLAEAGLVVSHADGTPPTLRADDACLDDLRLTRAERRSVA